MSDDIWKKLAAEFPKSAISWRAQSLTKTGDKAMALAYLDARDVRRRLNEVVGPQNWQNEFRDCGDGKLACRLSIRVDGEWIHKEDGAGETQVEAEKGAFSSALKRSAVAFGVGEYLYDLPTTWVPCETYEANGKKHWKAWNGNPWDFVRRPAPSASKPAAQPQQRQNENVDYVSLIRASKDIDELTARFELAWKSTGDSAKKKEFKEVYDSRKESILSEPEGYVLPSFDSLPAGAQQMVKNMSAG